MQATRQFIILSLLMVSTSTIIYSQNASDTSKTKADTTKQKEAKLDSTIKALSFKIDDLTAILKNSKDSDKEFTGIFSYDTSKKITVYSYNNQTKNPDFKKTARTIVVTRILMEIKDGYIVDVQIFSGNKMFVNYWAPITVSGNRLQFGEDYLYCTDNDNEAIMLQNALSYISLKSFFPEDKLYELNNKHYIDTVYKNVGINTVVDLRIYTDALATFGKEANGLFQTDVRIKQFIHRKHIANKGLKSLHYLKVNFSASKLDSKKSYVDSSNNLSRSDLYQKSKYNGEVALNIISSWLTRKTSNSYYVDFGAGYYTVNLARLKDTIPINVTNLFLEGGLNLRSSSNIGFDFCTRLSLQYSPQTDFNDQDKRILFLRMGGEVFWSPFENPASRIFGRINYFKGFNKSEKKRSFSQVQIGYSTLLSKVIGTK